VSGGITPLILNLYLVVGERSASLLAAVPPLKEPAVSIEQNLGGSRSRFRNCGIEKPLLHLQRMGGPSSSLMPLVSYSPDL